MNPPPEPADPRILVVHAAPSHIHVAESDGRTCRTLLRMPYHVRGRPVDLRRVLAGVVFDGRYSQVRVHISGAGESDTARVRNAVGQVALWRRLSVTDVMTPDEPT